MSGFECDVNEGRGQPGGRRQVLARLGALGLTAALGAALSACDKGGFNPMQPKAVKFNAVDITGAEYARGLNLPDPSGKVRTLEEFRGKVVVVFFGFTQCPDVCPTTMAELAEVRRRLGPAGSQVQGVFVSLDPERDTAPVLGDYIKAMDPSFVALRGSVDQVTQAAREFKVFFQKVPTADGKSYTLDHTAGAYVFDTNGKVRLFARYGMGADAMTADVKQLLADKG
jgi:protein SCO1/2